MNNDNNKIRITCKRCQRITQVQPFWDEHGFGYSAKIAICPMCGAYQFVDIVEDRGLDVNNDERYYMYEKG